MSSVVDDGERLYRRVQQRVGDQFCFKVVDGQTVFLHAAFNDPKKCPSMDRAILRYRGDPQLSRKSAHDGIVTLQTAGIRRLGPIHRLDHKGKSTDSYTVDVRADPLLGNCSHALVVMSPSTSSSGTFKRLKEGLVRLATEAGWAVEPSTKLTKRYRSHIGDILNCLLLRLRGRL